MSQTLCIKVNTFSFIFCIYGRLYSVFVQIAICDKIIEFLSSVVNIYIKIVKLYQKFNITIEDIVIIIVEGKRCHENSNNIRRALNKVQHH